MNLLRVLLAEAIGTFTFFSIGFLGLVGATAIGQGNGLPILLAVPFAFGLGLFAAIWLFGHVSSAHFNPAVTLAALIDGRLGVIAAIGYVVAQIVGAFAAAFTVFFVVGQSFVGFTITAPSVPEGQAFAAEALMTAVFVAVILTVTRRAPSQASFAIALTLLVINFALVPITGASVNPARSLAPAVVSGKYTGLWIYLTAPFLGSLLGWVVYRFFNPPEEALEVEVDIDDDDLEADLEDEV